MEELVVGLHIHSNYSDGHGSHSDIAKAGLKAGVDALIITDHNIWVQDLERYYSKGNKQLLMLVGEEVHDNTLKIGKNHLLIMNHSRELSSFSQDPQNLINMAKQSGALTFIAHPIEDPLEKFSERAFNWEDWNVKGFTGIELWNHLSELKTRSSNVVDLLINVLFPKLMTLRPKEETLKLWDNLIKKSDQPIVAIGGVDAHCLQINFGLLKISLYPYDLHFRSITTHLITPKKLTGSLSEDKKMIYEAFKSGHAFLGYDLPASTRGFRFSANNDDGQFIMGDKVRIQGGLTLQARLPERTICRLVKDGKIIKETTDREVLTHITKEPGTYRVEVYREFWGKLRGWIFSNPIYAHS